MTTAIPQQVFVPKSKIDYSQARPLAICTGFNHSKYSFSNGSSSEDLSFFPGSSSDVSEDFDSENDFLGTNEFGSDDQCSIDQPLLFDDVPRTPRRPFNILDPSNPSVLTEGLFLTVGIAALALGSYAVYRLLKAR
uniref:Syndecan n=1 Tax=Syphacia muris TaxID=451379 RepID=A0A0N5AEP8_9BILA